MVYFVDTSALLKRYVEEAGTQTVRRAFHRFHGSLSTSELALLEALSALARRRRKDEISGPQYTQARDDLLSDIGTRLHVAPLPDGHFAAVVVMIHAYRGRRVGCNDFLHLAAAEHLRTANPDETVSFMCSDGALGTLAAERGFPVFDPETSDPDDL
jgi:hypothetical protein